MNDKWDKLSAKFTDPIYDPEFVEIKAAEWFTDNSLGMPFPDYLISRSKIEFHLHNHDRKYDNLKPGDTFQITHKDIGKTYEYTVYETHMNYRDMIKTIKGKDGVAVEED